jgi:hypothetical protein
LLARSRFIQLGSMEVETPLLVPAMSSKAVGPVKVRLPNQPEKLVPASLLHTEEFLRGIDEAVLVSAYDIHHRFITRPDAFRRGFARSPYANPRILFIDSGWYEKSVSPMAGRWYHEVGEAVSFEESEYVALVDGLDKQLRAVLVSWDRTGTYLQQIRAAQDFFGSRGRFSSDILLKPEHGRAHHEFNNLARAHAARLRAFNIVGVTEKELGDSVLKRLTVLARLRRTLDDAGVGAPIHVFGGLDPLVTPLYFSAGGEIFDGLSWLRYAFRDGMSIHRDAVPLLDHQYERRSSITDGQIQIENLNAIAECGREMKVFFHKGCDWSKLRHGRLLESAFEAMESALRGEYGG